MLERPPELFHIIPCQTLHCIALVGWSGNVSNVYNILICTAWHSTLCFLLWWNLTDGAAGRVACRRIFYIIFCYFNFWDVFLDVLIFFVDFFVAKPHWNCWQGCLQEKEEKRQEKMCSRHVWPFLSFERYNEKEQMCSKHVWPSKLCPCLNFKRYNDDTSENLSNIDPPV